jgi:hypothetical protein
MNEGPIGDGPRAVGFGRGRRATGGGRWTTEDGDEDDDDDGGHGYDDDEGAGAGGVAGTDEANNETPGHDERSRGSSQRSRVSDADSLLDYYRD